MIALAFWILSVTVAIGVVMAVRYFSRERLLAQRIVPAVHGLAGAGGFLVLAVALRGGAADVPDRYGTASFAPAAAILIPIAIILGLTVTLRGRKPRPVGFLIGVHATVAVIGYVMLTAFYWLR
jgi:hypothetical protein